MIAFLIFMTVFGFVGAGCCFVLGAERYEPVWFYRGVVSAVFGVLWLAVLITN